MPIAQKPKPEQAPKSNKPVAEFSYRLTKASIWKNTSEDGKERYSVTFSRSYKAANGWRRSSSFGLYDLSDMNECSAQARNWILNTTRPQTEPNAA